MTTRYSVASADLDGNGVDETIVYLSGQSWCGSGGCKLLVLERRSGGFKVVGSTTITKLPIRLLDSRHNGWRDLGVWVQAGGIHQGHEAVLAFDGARYPSNPSLFAADRNGKRKGKVIIPVGALGRTILPTPAP